MLTRAKKGKAQSADQPDTAPKKLRSKSSQASSMMSALSLDARKKQLELEAAEERARLLVAAEEAQMMARLKEAQIREAQKLEDLKMQAKIDLLDKKLDASLAELEEKRSRAGSSMSSVSAERTVDWVAQQNVSASRDTAAARNERYAEPTAHQFNTYLPCPPACPPPATQNACQVNQAHCSSSPPVSQDQAIMKLADAVHNLAIGCARNSNQVTAADKLMSRIATPKELPTFKGDPMEWTNFRNFYEESTEICQFSNAENVCRLRKCLSGEAKECVSALLMGDISAENIMKTLELQFGRPEIIVNKLVSQLKKLPSLSLSYHTDIVSFSIKIKNCVVAAKAIKQDDYLRSPELTSTILSKLPCSLITRWADYAYEYEKGTNMTRLEQLSEFLDIEAKKISNVGVSLLQPCIKRFSVLVTNFNQQRPLAVLAQTKEALKCRFCHKRSDHVVTDCPKFKGALRKDRWANVRSNRLCPKCLVSDHDKETCKAPLCKIDDCGLSHHQILHWPIKTTEKPVSANVNNLEHSDDTENPDDSDTHDGCIANISASSSTPTPSHVLLKYARVRVHGPNGNIVTDALLDDGSTITMIDERVANQVGLKGRTESLRVSGAWDNSVMICQAEFLDFEISGQDSSRYKIIARTVKGINLPSQYTDPGRYVHLSGIKDSICSDHMKPSMIIGQDNYHLLAPLEVIEGDLNATRTVLGWSVHGRALNKRQPHGVTNAYTLFLSQKNCSTDDLDDLVRRSYALDALGVSAKPRQCSDDTKALEILNRTSKKVGDHWEVGLPWKDEKVKMTDSYPTAFCRLQGVEKKMRLNPDFQARYKERVQHLLENNYAQPCSEPDVTTDRLWYLPHFGVDNPNKKKLRLVFDAAAKSQGCSLNDYLLQGPDLLISLFGVLFRFREHQVAITGDIKDMFLRVHIRKEDQDALRFLWKDDVSSQKPPTKYVMNSLIFGACCSPFVAQYVKNRNAIQFDKEAPRAVKSIIENHYVDDLMDSVETESEAIQLVNDVRNIHKAGGFEIRNWTSNNKEVLKNLPEQDLGPSAVKFNIEGTSEGERTLGLYWFPADDVLSFDVSMKQINKDILTCVQRPTKREMLRVVMSVFDVQGFLAPLTIKSRILLQDTWRSGIAWDEPVKDKEFTKWRKWLECFEKVKSLRIPRWYLNATSTDRIDVLPGQKLERELHMFCDASPQAYAAVAYWRFSDGDNVTVAFIASKSRVAPLRPVSVPRLELQGAVLACRLAATIEQEHTVKADRRYFWTDSSTVLLWIMSDAREYKPFVANRLGEIDEMSKFNEWRYVPTTANVADYATKESVDNLTYSHPWFHGPDFLVHEPTLWPENKFTKTPEADIDVERKKAYVTVLISLEPIIIPDPKRFSSWMRLLRSTATFLVAIERWKRIKAMVDADKMNNAEMLIIRQAQLESFPDEISQINDHKPLSRKSRIWMLSPYVDHDGILRVRGRVDMAADVTLESKRPAILDGRSYVARLIIMHFHIRAAHANNETVINELRQRFWIVHLRPSVRSVTSKCLLCRIRKAKPVVPLQGDLPAGRVAHHCRPFSHCGLDLFGPINVTVGRRHEKRYGVIFTCMTVRAIHLEIVHSLSTDSLVMALRRMATRRGWPSDLYSDNGTNLHGAETDLNRLQNEAANNQVRWHFNPPLSPHMGGAWERLIRSVKTTLKVILKERAPRDETLATMLCEVEAIVNSRPLTHVSVSSVDEMALTPYHFILGSSSNLPPIITHPTEISSRKQWRVAQSLANMFWARWLKEALPCLLPRTMRSTNDREQLRVGDLVLVVDPASERNYWPRGVVEAVYPGADGRVRVVDVRTSRGTLRRRSAVRLVRLPSNPRGEECQ